MLAIILTVVVLVPRLPNVVAQNGTSTSLGDIETDSFFNGIIGQASSGCARVSFYTRQGFLDASGSYPDFATSSTDDDNKREIAAFFAHVTHKTGHITWNYNYRPAGDSIGFDVLNSPETVANDFIVSFETAFWFWMNNIHSIMTSGQGFGAMIRAINGGECKSENSAAVQARVQYYTNYCSQFEVPPDDNLSC